ncbi:beta-propeller domain-containing protein [Alkalibacillus aidingensis]|uniref:beta-propeller domain-containing protein n=1 Tax=Alkalibacillus aidingensis TaxID=2747607 RepID=UPI001660C4E0|nr:beta-propeller domain-containing protein [Alkalibacillus aidingensis]
MLKKIIWSISVMTIIGFGVLIFNLTTNNISAEIPSASSYVSTSKDWSIHFDDSMDPSTFTDETVTVLDEEGHPVSVDFDWNKDHTILTLYSPEDGYQLDETYQIDISDEVQTANGKQLSQSFVHSFETVAELPNIESEEQLWALLDERAEAREQSKPQQMQDESADGARESLGLGAGDDSSASNEASTSETNVQVDGIDEGDIVKSDGDYIYFARQDDIVIASSDDEDSRVVSQISEDNYHIQELYLHDDLLITIGSTHEPIREMDENSNQGTEAETMIYPPMMTQTTVYVYDMADREDPEQIREFSMEGSLSAARLMDGYLYLVGNNRPPVHILRNEDDEPQDDIDVRPFIKDTAVSDEGEPIDFEDLYFFPESDDESFMLLGSLDLNNMNEEANVETYLGASNQMYMSEDHIYTAVNKYNTESANNDDTSDRIMIARPANTEINQFKIDDGEITFNTSTVVNGTLLNQFSMDERDGTFRVATTKGDMWDDEEPSTNNLYTYDLDLNPLGAVEGLAEGEQIFSVRFMDQVAYMVTFEQVDPLFVIDLEDPSDPEVLGELKIPGFSNYLHPLDDDHVVGFGQHTELKEVEWSDEPIVRQVGLKLSVFDVSDPYSPEEKHIEILGEGAAHSEVTYNHKILYQHPEEENLFGFPAELMETEEVTRDGHTYEEHSFIFEGAFLYDISPDDGITLRDNITHQEPDIDHPDWESRVMRMVSVGDTLYTLSQDRMNVYDLSSGSVIDTVELPERQQRY